MEHVVTNPPAPFLSANELVRVHLLPAWKDNLVWLLEFGDDEVAVVDGPPVGQVVLDWCAARGRRLTTVLNTHTHGDHVGINRDLARLGALDGLRVVGPAGAAADVPGLTVPVTEGDTVALGAATARVLLTEGHLNGHVSYVIDDLLFCGDTLFGAGCGYLFDGPPETMHRSLERLAGLPAETRVCCAHEYTWDNLRFAWSVEPDNPALAERIASARAILDDGGCTIPSSIALERATNPFLRHHSPGLRAAVAAAFDGRTFDGPAAIFAATRALKDRKDYKNHPEPRGTAAP